MRLPAVAHDGLHHVDAGHGCDKAAVREEKEKL